MGLGLGITIVLPVLGFYGGFIDGAWALVAIAAVAFVVILKTAREWVQ